MILHSEYSKLRIEFWCMFVFRCNCSHISILRNNVWCCGVKEVAHIYTSNLSCVVNPLTNDTRQMVSFSHTQQGHKMCFMLGLFLWFYYFHYMCVFPGEIVYKFRGEFFIKILWYIYLIVLYTIAHCKGIQMWSVSANILIHRQPKEGGSPTVCYKILHRALDLDRVFGMM